MRPLIYIAGPYTHPDPVENTTKAVKRAMEIREELGCAVLVPHVTMLMHLIDPKPYEYWLKFDLDQMEHCSAVFRLDGESLGADREVTHAQKIGMAVFKDTVAGYDALRSYCRMVGERAEL